MKQHITLTDLEQLSEKGKVNLREWWRPKEGDKTHIILDIDGIAYKICYLTKERMNIVTGGEIWTPLLSIGQMIEYLTENGYEITLSHARYGENPNTEWWLDNISSPKLEGRIFSESHRTNNELADVLWQACVEILDTENSPHLDIHELKGT